MDVTAPTWSINDWPDLWRHLVERSRWGRTSDSADADPWAARAAQFDARLSRRWAGPHPLRDYVLARIEPDSTVLDIGAGTGAWAISLADCARWVTAVDSSPAMREVMRSNLNQSGVTNVEVVPGCWPEVDVPPHDYTLCSHAMYGAADLPGFVRRMIEVTRRGCFMVIRSCALDGIMAQAVKGLWGHPMDSPNFTIAYNILLQLGLTPGVVVDPEPWEPTVSHDLSDALATVKYRLRLGESTEHDAYLTELLQDRLQRRADAYVWPADVHSVLMHWQP